MDKRLGFPPVGIGETLNRDQLKLVLRESGNQAKVTCRNIKLCDSLEDGIEGTIHTVI